MEPIPFFFDKVNRSALVVKTKTPFQDWLLTIEFMDGLVEILKEGDVYLLPEFADVKQMENWLKKNFDEIFSDQLNNWYIDEEMWPKNRTFKMFKEWFDFSLYTMILDTQSKLIIKN